MASFHIRSISLPSRPHPLIVNIEEQISKLKTSKSSSIGQKVAGLKRLYDSVDDFLQMPLSQQSLSHEQQSQSVEQALNVSLGLLDMCSTTKDFFSQMKECFQGLESSLRRTRGGESGLNEVDAYMVSRKKLNKVICKYLRNLKRQEKNCRTTFGDNSDVMNMINILKAAEEISLAVLESILSFISQSKAKSKLSGWSINLSSEGKVQPSEIEKIDAELLVLKSSIDINQVHNVLKGLEAMDSSLQEAVEELDCVYRKFVKTQVSLLNILNH
ncbi:hypothetical protein P3X46_018764 [Hevea brasiliensis]|uniref:Uncharacterized protein n=1 Tax=Hevea brasiliensis TaxID=3981 RepID=A0ABQ9LRP1_HEVBR|nr:hypothetical protein P3X46_018764 [Hevea brasiliensis]